MAVLLMIILANILIITVIFYSKIYIHLEYQGDDFNDEKLSINVYIFKRVLKYNMCIATHEIKNNKNLHKEIKSVHKRANKSKNINFHIDNHGGLKHIFFILRYFARLYFQVMKNVKTSLYCMEFKWITIYGSADAAVTGIATGSLWTLKSLIITQLKKNAILINKPVINIEPKFGKDVFKIKFRCIFSMRLGNVMNIIRNLYVIKL